MRWLSISLAIFIIMGLCACSESSKKYNLTEVDSKSSNYTDCIDRDLSSSDNDLDTLSEAQSPDISSDNIINVESIKINFVSYTDETRTLEVTDQTIIKTILNYILSMEQSDYYGGPGSGGGIEVIISKDGTEHVYVFKSDGLIKDLKNPDKRVWYQSTEGAYDYLKSFFDL